MRGGNFFSCPVLTRQGSRSPSGQVKLEPRGPVLWLAITLLLTDQILLLTGLDRVSPKFTPTLCLQPEVEIGSLQIKVRSCWVRADHP